MRGERVLFELSETAALGADALQRILYQATGTKSPRASSDRWRGISFVRSTKAILLRCIREKGLEVTPEGWERLAALPILSTSGSKGSLRRPWINSYLGKLEQLRADDLLALTVADARRLSARRAA